MDSEEATSRTRAAIASFAFPSVSYLSEHEFESAAEVSPHSYVAVFVSTQATAYSDVFVFFADALRCLAENASGEIFEQWDALAGTLSCRPTESRDTIQFLGDALAPFSGFANLPPVPEHFSLAFEVLGVPGFCVRLGTFSPGDRHLVLALEKAAA